MEKFRKNARMSVMPAKGYGMNLFALRVLAGITSIFGPILASETTKEAISSPLCHVETCYVSYWSSA